MNPTSKSGALAAESVNTAAFTSMSTPKRKIHLVVTGNSGSDTDVHAFKPYIPENFTSGHQRQWTVTDGTDVKGKSKVENSGPQEMPYTPVNTPEPDGALEEWDGASSSNHPVVSRLNKWSLPSYCRHNQRATKSYALVSQVAKAKSDLERAQRQLRKHETLVRRDQRREKERLTGIELNPGPVTGDADEASSSHSQGKLKIVRPVKLANSRAAKMRLSKPKAFKNRKGETERQMRQVAAAVHDSVAKEVAEEDVAKQLEQEAPKKTHEEIVNERLDKAKITQHIMQSLHAHIPGIFHVVSCVKDSSFLIPGVSLTLEDLPLNLLPHRVITYEFVEMSPVIDDGRGSFFRERKRLTGGLFFDMLFNVSVHGAQGASMRDRVFGPQTIRVPWELFQVMNWRRFGASGTFQVVYDRVATFVPWFEDVPISNMTYSNNYLIDNCLVALLLLPFKQVEGDTLWDVIYKFVVGRGVRELYHSGPAEGVYSNGYHVTWAEVLGTARGDFEKMAEAINQKTSQTCVVLSDSLTSFKRRYEKVLRRADVVDQCRRFPCYVKDCVPPFPDLNDVKNHLAGAWKRLCKRQIDPTPEAKLGVDLIVAVLCRMLTPLDHVSWNKVIEEGAMRYTEDERPEFMAGAETFLRFIRDGGGDAPDPDTGSSTVADEISEFTVFCKREFYDHEAIKSNRYITSPTLRGRAMLYIAFHPVEEAIIRRFAEVLAKGRTVQEICAFLGQKGGDPMAQGLTDIWGTDLSSMERLVSGWMQEHIEHRIIQHLYTSIPEGRRLNRFFSQLLNGAILQGPSMKLFVDAMRYSGTQQTSIGNALCNMVWSSMLMFKARNGRNVMNMDDAKAAVETIMENAVFEGDDGFIRVRSDDKRELFLQAALDLGLDLKFENRAGGVPASNFCQLVYTMIEGKLVILADPAKIASRVSYFFCDKYKHTLKYDRELQLAKVLSYAQKFKGCPVISQILHVFMHRLGGSLPKILQTMRSDEPTTLKKSIAEQLVTKGRWTEVNLRQAADEFEKIYNDADINVVPQGAYEAMSRLFDYSSEQLRRMHNSAATVIADGSVRLNGLIHDAHVEVSTLGEKFHKIRHRVSEVTHLDERGQVGLAKFCRLRDTASKYVKSGLARAQRYTLNLDDKWWIDAIQIGSWILGMAFLFLKVNLIISVLHFLIMSPLILLTLGVLGAVGLVFISLIMYLFFGRNWLVALRWILWWILAVSLIWLFIFSPLRYLQGWVRKNVAKILDTLHATARKWGRTLEKLGRREGWSEVTGSYRGDDPASRKYQQDFLANRAYQVRVVERASEDSPPPPSDDESGLIESTSFEPLE